MFFNQMKTNIVSQSQNSKIQFMESMGYDFLGFRLHISISLHGIGLVWVLRAPSGLWMQFKCVF